MSHIFNKVPPKIKRLVIVSTICLGLVGFIALGLTLGERKNSNQKEQVVRNVLMDRNTREVSIDAMEADLKRLARENKELGRQVIALQNRLDRQAYVSGIKSDSGEINTKLQELNKKITALDEAYRAFVSLKQEQIGSSFQKDKTIDDKSYKSDQEKFENNSSMQSMSLHAELFEEDIPSSRSIHIFSEKKKSSQNDNYQTQNLNSRTLRDIVLPAGSILTGVFLNGMDAPTGHGSGRQQFPALVKIQKEAILPNNYRSDIRDCFLIVSGYGDLSSERAYLRGEVLSCITNKKEILEGRLDSYVVGPDGHAGVRGRLVSKQGQVIAKSLMAGFLSGLSKAFDVNAVPTLNTSSSGSVSYEKVYSTTALQGAAASGISSSLDRIANFYIEMAEGLFPVIEIDAGRKISVIVSKGARLSIKSLKDYEGKRSKEEKRDVFNNDKAMTSTFFDQRKMTNDR